MSSLEALRFLHGHEWETCMGELCFFPFHYSFMAVFNLFMRSLKNYCCNIGHIVFDFLDQGSEFWRLKVEC